MTITKLKTATERELLEQLLRLPACLQWPSGLMRSWPMKLEQDPLHPSLRLHGLEGQLTGLHAVAINLQYRITLELELREQEIILVNVGSHGEVY